MAWERKRYMTAYDTKARGRRRWLVADGWLSVVSRHATEQEAAEETARLNAGLEAENKGKRHTA